MINCLIVIGWYLVCILTLIDIAISDIPKLYKAMLLMLLLTLCMVIAYALGALGGI